MSYYIFNAFDSKMAYNLRDKDPKTLRDAYKMTVNIENNTKASGKLGRRDDPKLFIPRNNKKESDKNVAGKKPKEENKIVVINLNSITTIIGSQECKIILIPISGNMATLFQILLKALSKKVSYHVLMYS